MNKIHILLVEDNDGDILLITEAFEESNFDLKLTILKDGQESIDFLNKKEKYKDSMAPDLVILDVNLPKLNGHQVLAYIKNNEKLKHIPVIMFTTSSSENDIRLANQNNANCYITKPVEVEDYLKVIRSMESFWIDSRKIDKNKLN